MPPRRILPIASNEAAALSNDQIIRQQLLPLGQVFNSVFKDADLTPVQKIKQWINVVAYSAGKIVARQQRMTESDLYIEMNKAYYLRLQVIFADVRDGTSYWAEKFDFGCTFAQMMTHTFGVGAATPSFFFDYGGNENLDAQEVEAAKSLWINPFLWKKYGDLKTEMQNQMLPVLMKQRIEPEGDSYGFKSGGSLAEVTYSFLGALFQIEENSKYQERVRKAIAARPRNAVIGGAARGGNAAEAEADPSAAAADAASVAGDGNADGAATQPQAAVVRASPATNQPEKWSDAHMHWRHPLFFCFYLYGPLTTWHPNASCRQVCEFLKKSPRSGPPPQQGARIVSSDDSRSNQRAAARGEERRAVDDRNENLLESLRVSREAQSQAISEHTELMRRQIELREQRAADEARAASNANELTRLQLQLQLAQQSAASSTAHILQQHQALNVLKDLPLDPDQVKKRQKWEKNLAAMCFAIADAPPDNLDSIADSLNGMAPYHPPRSVSTANRAAPAPAPHRAAAGGGTNLHPQFNAAARANE